MKTVIFILQILISLFLIVAILLQKRGSALGSAFGSGGFSYFTRRGIEKKLFFLTCILSVVFAILSILNLVL